MQKPLPLFLFRVGRALAQAYFLLPALACYVLTGQIVATGAVLVLSLLPLLAVRLVPGKETGAGNWRSFVHTHHESMGLLAEQVNSVSKDIEESIGGLISDFMDMSQKASSQGEELLEVTEKMNIVDLGDQQLSTEELLTQVRGLLNDIIEQLVWISENMMRVTYEIEDLQDSAKNINGFMQQVDAIADKTNLLALNASIEAARAGQHGQGFMVVADEVRKLAQQSSQFSESIQKDMAAIAKGLDSSFESISEVVTKDMTPILTHKATIESMVSHLLEQKNTVVSKLGEAGGNCKEISQSIFTIVQKLQFQDRTKQRLEHVSEPLEEIRGELSGFIAPGAMTLSAENNAFLEKLKTSYTMAEERQVHERTPEQEQAEAKPQDDNNIDLF